MASSPALFRELAAGRLTELLAQVGDGRIRPVTGRPHTPTRQRRIIERRLFGRLHAAVWSTSTLVVVGTHGTSDTGRAVLGLQLLVGTLLAATVSSAVLSAIRARQLRRPGTPHHPTSFRETAELPFHARSVEQGLLDRFVCARRTIEMIAGQNRYSGRRTARQMLPHIDELAGAVEDMLTQSHLLGCRAFQPTRPDWSPAAATPTTLGAARAQLLQDACVVRRGHGRRTDAAQHPRRHRGHLDGAAR